MAEKSGVDAELKALMKTLLAEAKKKDGAKFVMALEDRLAIFDRALRLEALELKFREEGTGAEWSENAD